MRYCDKGSEELEKQPFSNQYKIYVINMRKRDDKWNSIKERYKHEKLTWSEGFNVKENYSIVDEYVKDGLLKPPQGAINYGNLGCASAHFNVWKRVAQGNEKCALVLEDDSVPTDQYLQGLYNCIKAAPDFDMIKMVALRPTGDDLNKHGLLKVKLGQTLTFHNQGYRSLPNVWTDAYLLSKSGAFKLLNLFRKNKFDLSEEIVDRAMTIAINGSTDFSKFVVKDQRYFVHDESDSDRKKMSQDPSRYFVHDESDSDREKMSQDPSSQHSSTAIKYNPEKKCLLANSYLLLSACVMIVLMIILVLVSLRRNKYVVE